MTKSEKQFKRKLYTGIFAVLFLTLSSTVIFGQATNVTPITPREVSMPAGLTMPSKQINPAKQAMPAKPAPAPAKPAPPAEPMEQAAPVKQAPPTEPATLQLIFKEASLDFILDDYREKTGLTLLRAPNLKATGLITLRSQTRLSLSEYLQALETVLNMNGIAIVKIDDKFAQVVPNAQATTEHMLIRDPNDREPLKDTGELVSQMIALKHIDTSEATDAIKSLIHAQYGKVNVFERINSIMVTDTTANINRVLKVFDFIDQPVEAREEPHVIQIHYAKASDIKAKLEEIIADAQEEAKKKTTIKTSRSSGSPGINRSSPAGVIRARSSIPTLTPTSIEEITEMAEKGIIRGKVKIVADERTNLMIIITRPENMAFFEKIVKVLDVETSPDVIVEVIRLEYAKAETVAETLNTLIGKEARAKDAKTGAATGAAKKQAQSGVALKDYVNRLNTPQGSGTVQKAKVGELASENIKILPDERTNSLLVMARKGDMLTIQEIIRSMDMMLLQVAIEAVVIQVDLSDKVTSGMHWVQRALLLTEDGVAQGAIAGSAGSGGNALDASSLVSPGTWSGASGLSTYFTHFGLNLDIIASWVKTDTSGQILSAPVIVTTDNTEAIIKSQEERYFLKGSSIDQWGNVRPETETREIGIELKVTPHINNNRNVVMEIAQIISDVGESQVIQQSADFEAEWPTKKERSLTAEIAVRDRETIILGGLVRNSKRKVQNKVPILGSIPILGRLFRSDVEEDIRSEVVVFITPRVLELPEEIEEESRRRKDALNIDGLWKKGWTESKLAEEDKKARKKKKLQFPAKETEKSPKNQ